MEDKEQKWRRHVEAAKGHPASIQAYCREHNLSPSSFHYWQKKLKKTKKSIPKESSFVPVKVTAVRKESTLPNPEWVAQFVAAFLRSTS